MKKSISFILFIIASLQLKGQNTSLQLNGYIKDMQTLWHGADDELLNDNLIHNRLNFSTYAGNFTLQAGMRNRFIWGDFVRTEGYGDFIETDNGFLDMSWNWAEGGGFLLNTSIDRLYIDYSYNKWQLTLGRQRINWGVNLVWNPNDVFNAYSFLDFDYEERPGTDALRIQYYTGLSSSLELVGQMADSTKNMALAGLWRFNVHNYDVQMLAGKVQSDWVTGLGWAGDIAGAGFRGEGTWFYSPDASEEDANQVVASVSADYTFTNSLYVHGGVLYNSKGKTKNAGSENYFLNSDLSAKNLSFARYSIFLQTSAPISPIINSSISGIINPLDGSLFVGPTLSVSLSDNLALSAMAQVFAGKKETEFGGYGQLFYLRFKYGF